MNNYTTIIVFEQYFCIDKICCLCLNELSHFRDERKQMETIRVDNGKVEVGEFRFSYSSGMATAFLPSATIRAWLPAMYEVHSREVFSREISSFRDTGRMTAFTFVDPSTPVEVMKTVVLHLVAQAAQLHTDRERARSRSNHPSSGRNLVVVNPDRYHKQKFINRQPTQRGR